MDEAPHVYAGKDVVVRFHARRCLHAAECVRGLPSVFDPERRPWVRPDAASADEVAAVVARCPTGALVFERKDGGSAEPAPDPSSVTVEADGPLYLRGDLRLEDPDGRVVETARRMALCRCGASAEKPRCDGSHARVGFRDPARVVAATSSALNATPTLGPVTIRPAANGPLLLAGSFDVHGSEGCMAFRAGRAALCRCGASGRKPLCDGSHATVGFQG